MLQTQMISLQTSFRQITVISAQRLTVARIKPMYRLSNSLPYLLARLGVRMGELFVRVVRKEGLTLPMYRVLAALAEQARPLRLGELARLTSAEMSTLSRLVADMHRQGIVSRARPQNDQRSLQVALTPRGAALAARFMPVAAHYENVATGNMTARNAAALKATLVQLYENLDRLEREVESGEIAKLIGSGPRGRPRRSPNKRSVKRRGKVPR
jgi:MarR family transcriptional regulator, organic hydroperoxide resistance regulator